MARRDPLQKALALAGRPVGVEALSAKRLARRRQEALDAAAAARLDDPATRALLADLGAPAEAQIAVLALGANLGDRVATLRAAVRELAAAPGVWLVAVSPCVETEHVGGPDQPDFLNAVAVVATELAPHDLLALANRIEAGHGRVRLEVNGPRTLDVDIVTYGGLVYTDEVLTLPHPRAAVRAFVLVPWSLVDPEAVLLGAGPVAELARRAADFATTRRRDDIDLLGD